MKVISGIARGTRLETLEGDDITRPTINRVKEAMFSTIQFLLEGATVLDLFAGSGQLGIEALSRGAQKCVFVDQNKTSADIIRKNLKAAGLLENARVTQTTVEGYLSSFHEKFDIVLLDPPYHNDTVAKVLPLIEKTVAPGGTVLAETERDAVLPSTVGCLSLQKQYRYGTVLLSRYTHEVDFDALDAQ